MSSTGMFGGIMRHLLRIALVTMLSTSLVAAATPPVDPIVGLLAEANKCNLSPGTTLFVNTEVWTAINGAATILLTNPSATLLLTSNSRMRFLQPKNGSVVELEEGALRFASKQPFSLQALSGAVEFRSHGPGPSSGEIRIIGKNRIAVTAVDAPILVSMNGDSLLVMKGYEYTLDVLSDVPSPMPKAAAGASGAKPLSDRGLILVSIATAAAAITTGSLLGAMQGNRSTFASPFIP